MTGAALRAADVFNGIDATGRAVAKPWQAPVFVEDARPDVIVRFQTVDRAPSVFSNVQGAIDHVVALGPDVAAPMVIEIGPGFYEGPVIIPPGAPPLVLRGAGAEATVIAAPIDAKMSGLEYDKRFKATIATAGARSKAMFAQITARNHLSTGNTAVLRIASDDVTLIGLTIRNDYACDRPAAAPEGDTPDVHGRFARGQHQAVALMVDGVDRIVVRDCVLTSFQDTLYLRRCRDRLSRALFERCQIAGDVDFIFGGGTAYFDACTVQTRGLRGAQSWALAPSTPITQAYGFVLNACAFTHDGEPAGQNGHSFLGRQWFEGVRATPYGVPTIHGYSTTFGQINRFDPPAGMITRQTLEAVGKVAVIGGTLGAHLRAACLWDDWAAGPWSPRYRPVQKGGADFLRYLSNWLQDEADAYHTISSQCWLQIAGGAATSLA